MSARRPIAPLPPLLVERIAAGEAIERPASAVKELVENALDADATEIIVEVSDGGLASIRVADDGYGIPADELALACQRHTTSKLTSLDQLAMLTSLGFRGEALASLVSIASLSIISATASDGFAAQVQYRDGDLVFAGPASRRAGTTVSIRGLFASLPGRRKFMGSGAAETAHVTQVVRSYALLHPGVRFALTADARLVLRTSGSGRVEGAMGECWSTSVRNGMLALPAPEGAVLAEIEIDGWIGDRATTRSTRSGIVFGVNGRPVHADRLQQALEAGYRAAVPRGRHPYAVIRVTTPPDEVDPNIHPAKAQVLVRREAEVAGSLTRLTRAALATVPDQPGAKASWQLDAFQPLLSFGDGDSPARQRRVREPTERYEPAGERVARARRLIASLPTMRLLGQVRRSLILLEGPDALYLVDQHRAHERILYERLAATPTTVQVQSLLEPLVLELKRHEAAIFSSRLDQLGQLGFRTERVGDMVYLVHSVPVVTGAAAPYAPDEELTRTLSAPGDAWDDRLRTAVACRTAIRRGVELSAATMRQVLLDLAAAGSPAVCPHGSPLILEVTESFLERQFDWQ